METWATVGKVLTGLVSFLLACAGLWGLFRRRIRLSAKAGITDFDGKMPKAFQDGGDKWYGFDMRHILVTITNKGHAEAKDLELSLPCSGTYLTDQPGGEESDFNRDIKIGSLRGRGSITVQIWTRKQEYALRDEIRLTHADGISRMQVGKEVYSAPGKIGEIIAEESRTILLFAIVVLVAIFVPAILSSKDEQTKQQQRPTTAPTTKQ